MFRLDAQGRLMAQNRLRALDQACDVPVDPVMALDPAGSYSRSSAGPSVRSSLALGGTAWQPLGPAPAQALPFSGVDFGAVSGRVTALAIHPSNPSIVFAGAATGGIWKSTDAGGSWRPVSDTAPALASSAIAFAPSNPSILFAATGETDSADLEFKPTFSLGTYLGAGLLRSVDGGESWARIDVDLPGNSVLSRVVVHPANPQGVVVSVYMAGDIAANRCALGGIYVSTDGGVHFTRTFTHNASDLAQDPNQPDTLYAAFGISQTADPARNCPEPAAPSGVYRSTDFGATWSPSLVPATPGATFTSPTSNIKISVGRTNPATLYASVLDTNNYHTNGGIFVSTDGGATWAKRSSPQGACPDADGVDQCEYNHYILASPADANTAYFGAVNLWKTTDGAVTWKQLFDIYGSGGSVHVDQHAAAIHPSAPNTVYLANDGGVYRTRDGGSTFENLNRTLTLAQFNGIAFSPTDPRFLMGGTQDNGNLRFRNSLLWTDRTGGDGGFNLIRQNDPTWILNANYYAYMYYSSDGGDNFNDVTPAALMDSSGNPKEGMAFYPPAASAPAAPGSVFFAGQRVWVNPTFGSNQFSWTARSASTITTSTFTALEVVGDGSGPMWGGTRRGEVFFSIDGGATFASRVNGLPVPTPIVSKIKAVSADGRTAYLTLGGFTGLPAAHVFRTTDGGQSWTNVSGNLPDAPASALAIDPSDPNGLFVGTDAGVFHSTNGGASWTSFNQGLPNALVTDLVFLPTSSDLVASTYGRGMFLVTASGGSIGPFVPGAAFQYAPVPPAPGQSVLFTDLSTGPATSWTWDFGDGYSSTERNPRHVFSQPGTYPVRLTASTTAGSGFTTRDVVVVSGVSSPATLQAPVVLDAFGVPPTHFTSDLVAVNRGGAETRLSVQYLGAPGTPGALPIAQAPKTGLVLEAGRELRIPDVIAFLRDNGYSLPASGPTIVGTLCITFEDVSDPALVFAGSRTTTPNPNAAVGGSFGLFASAVVTTLAPSSTATVFALKEDATARTNLALVDVPGGSGPPTLSLQLVDGDTGLNAGAPTPITLGSGEWRQLNSVLGSVTNGYARVTKTGGGSDRFLVYGAENDGAKTGGGTSDASFLGPDASPGLVPIVLRTGAFSSELVLANPTNAAAAAQLVYTPAAALGGGSAGTAHVSIGANQQLRVPDAIQWLRDTLGLPLLAGDVDQGGTLLVSGAVATVRTSNPNPDAVVGGSFGLAYPAVPSAARAKTEAWVYGALQNADTRSNLAIADARVGDPTTVTYVVDIFDSLLGDGIAPAATLTVPLAGGQWQQIGRVLGRAGLTNGYIRVRPQSGASDYVVYLVLNDGANPGERTSDGSYVAMSGVK
jgi:PKD repeat protein